MSEIWRGMYGVLKHSNEVKNNENNENNENNVNNESNDVDKDSNNSDTPNER